MKTKSKSKNFYAPESPATTLMFDMLSACGDSGKLEEKYNRKTSRSNTKVTAYSLSENKKLFTVIKGNSNLNLRVTNIEELTGYNYGVKKWYVFLLAKINQQVVSNGIQHADYISFDLQETVDNGMYTETQHAFRGFNKAYKVLKCMEIYETDKGENGEELTLFIRKKPLKNGTIMIWLNQFIDWTGFMLLFVMLVPSKIYQLSDKGFTLTYYICRQIRQRTGEIKRKGYINIPLRSVQAELFLKDEKSTKNPFQAILKPIESAVNEINEAYSSGEIEGIQIESCYDKNTSVSSILSSGYLKIHVSGEYADYTEKIANHKIKKINQSKKRKERIETNARAKALEKTMKKAADQMKESKAQKQN